MRTPVIIPAYNEESRLGETLKVLPRDLVEPIVAVNGSTDATAQVAAAFGVQVHETAEQGKMPAIQDALSHLGERAIEPLIILDADTQPIFPQKWHDYMLRPLIDTELPAVVGGPVWYTGHPRGEAFLRSIYRAGRTFMRPKNGGTDGAIQFGPNMSIGIRDTSVLDQVMGIPNYWPGEDRALAEVVSAGDGTYHGLVHPYAAIWNPTSVSAISLKDRLQLGRKEALRVVADRYVERGPQGSTPYDRELT